MAAIERVNEPIDVLTAFEGGAIRPVKFRWAGRVYTVDRVTFQWITRDGAQQLRHFAVATDGANVYEIVLNNHSMQWTLVKVQMEG